MCRSIDKFALTVSLILALCVSAFAFAPQPPQQAAAPLAMPAARTLLVPLHMFKGLGDAFKNDDSLGKRENAGLKNGPAYNENVLVNGKPVPGAVVGQKLTVVAGKVRVKIPVNCQQGDCGTCMVKFNGRKVKACQTVLPSGKAIIETL